MQSIQVEILNQYQTSDAGAAAANRMSQSITPDSIRMAATMVTTIPIIMVYPLHPEIFRQRHHAGLCEISRHPI